MDQVKKIKRGIILLKIIIVLCILFFLLIWYWYLSKKWGQNALIVMSVVGASIILLFLRIQNLTKQITTNTYTEFTPKTVRRKIRIANVLLILCTILFLCQINSCLNKINWNIKNITSSYSELIPPLGPLLTILALVLVKSQLKKSVTKEENKAV